MQSVFVSTSGDSAFLAILRPPELFLGISGFKVSMSPFAIWESWVSELTLVLPITDLTTSKSCIDVVWSICGLSKMSRALDHLSSA